VKKFWISALILYGLSFLLTNSMFYKENIEIPVDSFYANFCAKLISLLGYEVHSDSYNIIHPDNSLQIAKGCDAVLPVLLLTSTIFIFPGIALNQKFKGAITGLLLLATVNIIRIISLFFVGLYAKSWFDFFHVEFWQALFILLSVWYFFAWLSRQKTSS